MKSKKKADETKMFFNHRLKRKAQSSIEFVILISFTIMVASTLFYVMQNNIIDAEKARTEARVGQLMNIISNEITMAQLAVPVYTRTFYLPNELYGSEYTIEAGVAPGGGTDIIIKYKGEEYVFLLTTTLQHANRIKKGENIITKECAGCEVTMKTPVEDEEEEPEPDPDPDPDPEPEVHYFTITTNHNLVEHSNTNLYFDLSLAPSEFWQHVSQDGGDIRVYTEQGTQVAREISSFNKQQQTGSLFFNSAGLSTTQETTYNITYGDPELQEPEANSTYGKNNVWDPNYVGVWHLDEDPSTTTHRRIKDSTQYGNNGTFHGDVYSNQLAQGKIGMSLVFNGEDNVVRVKDSPSTSIEGNQFTLSAWVYPTNIYGDTDAGIISKSHEPNVNVERYHLGIDRDGRVNARRHSGSLARLDTEYNDVVNSEWQLLTARYDGSTLRAYVNGVEVGSMTATGNIDPTDTDLVFGMRYDNSRFYTGNMDEIRVSNVARLPAWIRTEYNNQANNAVFWSLEEEEDEEEPEVMYFTITTNHNLVTNANTNLYYDLSLAPEGFWDNVKDDGGDIRVTRNDGVTEVAREVSSFDRSTKTGALFFDSTGLSTTSPTTWRIYFGDEELNEPLASSTIGRNSVWDSNYGAVWHLAEQGSGSSGEYIDSTSNNNHGTGVSSPTQVNGKLGLANYFNVDLINVPSSSSLELGTDDFTISAWINTDEADLTHNAIFGSGATSYANPGYVFNIGNSEVIRFWVADGYNRIHGSSSSGLGFIDGEWHYISVRVVRNSGRYYYHNGNYVSASTGSVFPGQNIASGSVKRIGRWSSSPGWAFKGIIDELRISRIARSEAWIQTEFNNQNDPGAFWSTGEVTGDPDVPGVPEPGITITRVQYVEMSVPLTSRTVSFGTPPVEGNLLIVMSGHRTDDTNPDISQSGWTRHLSETTLPLENSYRRGIAVWSKKAGSDESSDVTISWGGNSDRDAWVILMEFSGAENYEFFEAVTNNSGSNGVTNLNIGTTSAPSSSDVLVIGTTAHREDISGPVSYTGLGNEEHYAYNEPQQNHSAHASTAFIHSSNGNQPWSTTASWTNLRVATGALLVFELE